jgi:hypothetical protein
MADPQASLPELRQISLTDSAYPECITCRGLVNKISEAAPTGHKDLSTYLEAQLKVTGGQLHSSFDHERTAYCDTHYEQKYPSTAHLNVDDQWFKDRAVWGKSFGIATYEPLMIKTRSAISTVWEQGTEGLVTDKGSVSESARATGDHNRKVAMAILAANLELVNSTWTYAKDDPNGFSYRTGELRWPWKKAASPSRAESDYLDLVLFEMAEHARSKAESTLVRAFDPEQCALLQGTLEALVKLAPLGDSERHSGEGASGQSE